jgi:fibulin 1/2
VSCLRGFYFNTQKNQCLDINECDIENNGCSENQVCENRAGSYACVPQEICRIGFSFDVTTLTCKKDCDNYVKECDEPVPVEVISSSLTTYATFDDSEFGASSNISFNATYDKAQRISCRSGFIYHEVFKKCVDVNECKSNQKSCDHFCRNTEGSFRCYCRRGYRVHPTNRTTCIDINECLLEKNTCSHSCKNVNGSFRCLCPKGFKLGPNKRSCEDVNECIEKRGTCGKQICNNLIGSYACYERECPRGYKAYLKTSRNDFK